MDAIIKECAWETTDGLGELRGRLERIYELRDAELRDAVKAESDRRETEFARLLCRTSKVSHAALTNRKHEDF